MERAYAGKDTASYCDAVLWLSALWFSTPSHRLRRLRLIRLSSPRGPRYFEGIAAISRGFMHML